MRYLWFLLLISCGSEPTYVTQLGINVFVHPGALDYGEARIDGTVRDVAQALGEPQDVKGMNLYLTTRRKACGGAEAACWVSKPVDLVRIVAIRGTACIAFTGYGHHLVHRWRVQNGLDTDGDHKDPSWTQVDKTIGTLGWLKYCGGWGAIFR